MQLSKHFNLNEFIISESAKRAGINNMPPADHIENLKKLCINVLEPIRDHFSIPIHISSGYRCKALNRLIGGASNSEHTLGQAVDLDVEGVEGVDNKKLFMFIKDNLPFNQLIYEFGDDKNPAWVHVSFSPDGKQRKEILRAIKQNNKTVYVKYK
jgi:hypothetical protein